MFVAYEGVDKSGKSTLSVNFQRWLNDEYRDADGMLKVDPHLGDFIWTKEPSFSSDEADLLNSGESPMNEYQRERMFFESRMRHQELLGCHNVICDRYVWSGIAYAWIYSRGCYEFVKELYLSENLFMAPDLYVFVDTPPEVCYDRDCSLDLDKLKAIREAYLTTKSYIKTPIITIQGLGGEQRTLDRMVTMFLEWTKKATG